MYIGASFIIYFLMVTRFTAILIISIYFTFSFGQSVDNDIYTRFNNYNSLDGLCSNQVNDIVQDKQGFIWIATENGLSRFDGYSFINYYHQGDSLSIPGNIVTSLAVDNSNNLWIGTTSGLCRMSLATGEVLQYKFDPKKNTSPRNNHIRKLLFSDAENTLYIESLEGTLTIYNHDNNLWVHHIHVAVTQPYYRYHALFRDNEGNIWTGGRNTPIMKFDGKKKVFRTIYATGEIKGGKRDNDLADIFQTSKNEWYVVATDGIYQFTPDGNNFKKILATSTFSIAESPRGEIWFGTGNGLYKYIAETKTFTSYRSNLNNPYSLGDNHVNKVFIDKTGNIWVGARNGLSCLTRKSKRFNYFFHIPGVDNGLTSNNITSMVQGKEGNVYIGTASHGLNVWKPNESHFTSYRADANHHCTITSDRISTLYMDQKGLLWVGLWAGLGFNRFDIEKECFTRFAVDYSSRKVDWYNAFLEDSRGNFYVGQWGSHGLMNFDRCKGAFIANNYLLNDKPYNRPVYQIVNNGCGIWFFLSNVPYIYLYDSTLNQYTSIPNQPFSKPGSSDSNNMPFQFEGIIKSVSNGYGLTLFLTNNGVLGHTREDNYFNFYQGNSEIQSIAFINRNQIALLKKICIEIADSEGELTGRIEGDFSNYKEISALPSNRLLLSSGTDFLIVDSNNSVNEIDRSGCKIIDSLTYNTYLVDSSWIWIGSSKGLIRHELKKNQNRSFKLTDNDLIVKYPVSFILNSNNNYLLTFTPTGIFRVNKSTLETKLLNLKNVPEGLSMAVKSAEWFNQSTIWIGTELEHFQVKLDTGEIIYTNLPSNKRLSSHLTTVLLEDINGNIWVGTSDKGLNRIDRNSEEIHHFFAHVGTASLPSNKINALLQTGDGRVWVGTDKGLCYIVGDFAVRVNELNDKFSIASLVEDVRGNLWVGTSSGLVKIDIYTSDIQFFDDTHGFPSQEFSKAALRLSDSRLAFGTSKGFVVFAPDSLTHGDDLSGDVSISGVSVFGKSVRCQLSRNDTIKLHYKQNFIQINFTAFDYGKKPGTKFRYRLRKVNPNWVESQSQSVSYTNIQPGKYLFEVTKIQPNGIPSPNYTSLLIIIPPPFWQTVWFRLLIVLILIGGIGAYLLAYIKQLKSDRRNVELEQKLLISQMNPHFIFNSLTAIQSFMYGSNPEEAGNYLSSFSRLVRLILESSRSQYIPIKQEIQTLKLYLMLQKLRFPDKFEYDIDVDPIINNGDFSVPPLLAQPFIENSIEHGILKLQGKGMIKVSFLLRDDLVNITVEDNGIGIDKSIEINEKKRLTHTSHATSITRERIKNISKSRRDDCGVFITDLSCEGKQGTRVQLIFPVKFNN